MPTARVVGGRGAAVGAVDCIYLCLALSEESEEVNILRWERNFNEGERDRRKGWYLPVKLNMA